MKTASAMIDTIIFDAEGVVIDTEPIWDLAQSEFLRRRGVAYDRAGIKPLLTGKSALEGTEILQAKCGILGDPHRLTEERLELVRQHLEAEVAFVPGFEAFFQRVRLACQTCIGTSMPEDLLALADRRLGLSGLFAGRIYSLRAVGCRSKPHPDLFLHAARQLGSTPANCLVIEDAPHGVEAARRAGMKCIALTTTYDRELLSRADLVADSFTQIDPTRF